MLVTYSDDVAANKKGAALCDQIGQIKKGWSHTRFARQQQNMRLIVFHMFAHVNETIG